MPDPCFNVPRAVLRRVHPKDAILTESRRLSRRDVNKLSYPGPQRGRDHPYRWEHYAPCKPVGIGAALAPRRNVRLRNCLGRFWKNGDHERAVQLTQRRGCRICEGGAEELMNIWRNRYRLKRQRRMEATLPHPPLKLARRVVAACRHFSAIKSPISLASASYVTVNGTCSR
jgi:hypothetical protein